MCRVEGLPGLKGKVLTLELGHGQGSITGAGTPGKKSRAPAGCMPLPSHSLWTPGAIPFPLPSPAPGSGAMSPAQDGGGAPRGRGRGVGTSPLSGSKLEHSNYAGGFMSLCL